MGSIRSGTWLRLRGEGGKLANTLLTGTKKGTVASRRQCHAFPQSAQTVTGVAGAGGPDPRYRLVGAKTSFTPYVSRATLHLSSSMCPLRFLAALVALLLIASGRAETNVTIDDTDSRIIYQPSWSFQGGVRPFHRSPRTTKTHFYARRPQRKIDLIKQRTLHPSKEQQRPSLFLLSASVHLRLDRR